MKHPSLLLLAILVAVTTVGYAPVASIAEPHSQTAKKSAAGGQTTLTRTGLWTKTATKSRVRRAKAAVAGQPATVTVRPGDSLWSIAAEVLHSDRPVGRYVERIYDRNQRVIGDDPDLIYAGQQLRLPGVGRSAPVSSGRAEGAVSARFADRTIRIGRGDTVWSIANGALREVFTRSEARRIVRFLPIVHESNRSLVVSLAAQSLVERPTRAVSRFVTRIHEANEEVIGPNPNLVHPGQVLELPPVEGATVTLTHSMLNRVKERPREFLEWARRVAGLPKKDPTVATADRGRRECCAGPHVAKTGKPRTEASGSLTAEPANQDESKIGRLVPPLLVAGFVLLLLWRSRAPRGGHALSSTPQRPAVRDQGKTGPSPPSPLERRPSPNPYTPNRPPISAERAQEKGEAKPPTPLERRPSPENPYTSRRGPTDSEVAR